MAAGAAMITDCSDGGGCSGLNKGTQTGGLSAESEPMIQHTVYKKTNLNKTPHK